MNDKYTIDEISKFLNIPKSTLRYYDSINLCKPAHRDENSNYRFYEYNQIFLLSMIGRLKKLRLSLEQIKAHSRVKNVAFLEKLLLERRNIIRMEMDELFEINKQNEKMIKKIEQSKIMHSCPLIEERQIPARYLYRLDLNFSAENLYAYIKILYTSYIKNIKNSPVYEKGEIALEISRDNLLSKQFKVYNAIGFFVENSAPMKTELLYEVPAGMYAVGCHTGSYKSISRTYKKLCQYILEHGFTIIGSGVETSLINIAMTANPDEFVTEIQIPIKK